jgi:hypothetical protein
MKIIVREEREVTEGEKGRLGLREERDITSFPFF